MKFFNVLSISVLILFLNSSCHVFKSGKNDNVSDKEGIYKLSKSETKEGFKILFDGTSMSQWTSNTDEYILENNCIVMHPKQGLGYGNLYTKEEFDNFILRFEFSLSPEGNSGLGIRHKLVTTKSGYDGMELQILDNEAEVYKDLKPYQYHGSVYGWIPAKRGFLKPAGEWNSQEVIADGNHIKVILNGETILDGNLKEATKDTSADKIPATLFYEKGHIAFLGHDSLIKLRNIRIKPIDDK